MEMAIEEEDGVGNGGGRCWASEMSAERGSVGSPFGLENPLFKVASKQLPRLSLRHMSEHPRH